MKIKKQDGLLIHLTEDEAIRLYLLANLIPSSEFKKVELNQLEELITQLYSNDLIHSIASSIGTEGLGLKYTLERIVKK